MNYQTHFLASFFLSLVLLKYGIISSVFAFILGSIFPDIFENIIKVEHRSIYVHNFLTAIIFCIASYKTLVFSFFLGYLFHLILDSLTIYGVYFGKARIRGRLKSLDVKDNLLVTLLFVIIFLIVFL